MDVDSVAGGGTGSTRLRSDDSDSSFGTNVERTGLGGGGTRCTTRPRSGSASPWGSQPPCLGEPREPQERIQLRTMEQLADVVPMVQILDIPVVLVVEQLADVLRFFASLLPVPEQDIEVPKILLDDVPLRTVLRGTQLAEQLVEVPTIVSFSSLQRTMEQRVDIPAPRREPLVPCSHLFAVRALCRGVFGSPR